MGDLKTLFQDNALTESKYDFTTLEKNIMYMMMSQLNKADPADKYYHISVSEMQDKTGVSSRYSDYDDAVTRMMKKIITISKPNGNILKTTLISSAEYMKGRGVIELGIDPKLRPFLFDLKQNFTTFQLELALSLKSKFSKRMYEMLSQWKTTKYWKVSVSEFKERIGLIDPTTGLEQYSKWSMFESRVLKVAHKEINAVTDIRFSYEPEKVGKRYEKIIFIIEHKPYQMTIDYKDDGAALFSKLVNRFGLRKDQAQKVIDSQDAKWINKKLHEIQVKQVNGEVSSIGGYSSSILGV